MDSPGPRLLLAADRSPPMFGRSFRSRLTSFFIGIVILPMVAVSVILFRLVADSERGKSDARLSQAQTAGSGLFAEEAARAARAGRELGASPRLAAAIGAKDAARIEAEFGRLAQQVNATKAILVLSAGERHEVGSGMPVA